MAVGLRHHIHEGEGLVVLIDLEARGFAAQDFCENIILVVGHVSEVVLLKFRRISAAEG